MTPLKGGFTLAEQTAIGQLVSGVGMLLSSLHDAAADPKLATAEVMRMYCSAIRDGFHALAGLVHTNIEQEGSPEYAQRESQPREVWVGTAFWYLGRAVSRCTASDSPGPYLWGPAKTWLDQAVETLQSVDWHLAYATPLPDDVKGLDGAVVVSITPTVVGPHGDQRMAGWCLHRSAHYFLDALDDCAELMGPGVSPGATGVWKKGSEALRVLLESMAVLAGVPTRAIPVHPERPDMPVRFLHVERLQAWLTDYLEPFSCAFRFHEVNADGLVPWISQQADQILETGAAQSIGTLLHASARLTDAWRQSDRAAWSLMRFVFTP